jgi:hypothetical protein
LTQVSDERCIENVFAGFREAAMDIGAPDTEREIEITPLEEPVPMPAPAEAPVEEPVPA